MNRYKVISKLLRDIRAGYGADDLYYMSLEDVVNAVLTLETLKQFTIAIRGRTGSRLYDLARKNCFTWRKKMLYERLEDYKYSKLQKHRVVRKKNLSD